MTTHLHVHSDGSALDGYSKVGMIARRAAELGQTAIAITDHGEVNQHYAFQKACLEQGVKPILGMEGYWVPDITEAREFRNDKGNLAYPSPLISHICLLAANQKGLSNLWALSSVAYDETHHHHRPLADPALMRQYSEGIYASDGCLMTRFSYATARDDVDECRQIFGQLAGIYGDRFYSELHTWQYMDANDDPVLKWSGHDDMISTKQANAKMTKVNQMKVRLATEMGIPMVIVNDAHHSWPEQWRLKELIWKFKPGNPDQAEEYSAQKADHIMGDEELYFWMDRHGIGRDVVSAAIKYSDTIAENCNAEIKPMLTMPRFTPSADEDLSKFIDQVEDGFKRKVERGGLDVDVYWPRLEEEIELICSKQFHGYFLVVADYVKAAKSGSWNQYVNAGAPPDPMLVGPGRGSAGGSLVAWLMDITALDPIKYDLLFSRFLNPGRKGFPDIDIDFPRSKCQGIKGYLEKRWGEDHVCSICTIGRNKARGTLKDLCRVYDIPWDDRTDMAKIIEQITAITDESELENANGTEADLSWNEIVIEKGGELAPYARKYPGMFDDMEGLIDTARSHGVHAAAVLISNDPITGLVPTRIKKGNRATQFDMYDIEELGGLKGDLLALRHLDALDIVRDLAKKRHDYAIDYEAFGDDQYSDPAIWDQVDRGQLAGIFQIATPSATEAAIDFKPRNERDVAALISIIRPGVRDAGLYDTYLARRKGLERVKYDHPMMEAITCETYGIMIYQEQLMAAARDLAFFTPDEASDLQKALGKKYMEKIQAMEVQFIDGCLANPEFMAGRAEPEAQQIAKRIWTSIEASGRYAFNKSHAQGYALVACWEIWVKHYFPAEFITACMQVDPDKMERYIRDARRRGIALLPPDINESSAHFELHSDGIRWGLEDVAGIGPQATKDIALKRPYFGLEDYVARTEGREGGKKSVVESLIKIGAFDEFGTRRQVLEDYYDMRISGYLAEVTLERLGTEGRIKRLHDTMAKKPKEFPVFDFDSVQVVYEIEKELVGNYITADPMEPYAQVLDEVAVRSPVEMMGKEPGEIFTIGGQVSACKVHKIKKKGFNFGKEMAWLQVLWNEEDFEITLFPETYQAYKNLIDEGKPVACEVERDDRGCHLLRMDRLDLMIGEQE